MTKGAGIAFQARYLVDFAYWLASNSSSAFLYAELKSPSTSKLVDELMKVIVIWRSVKITSVCYILLFWRSGCVIISSEMMVLKMIFPAESVVA